MNERRVYVPIKADPLGYVCGKHMQPAEHCPACERDALAERIRELEAERSLLVAEVRRCWAEMDSDFINGKKNWPYPDSDDEIQTQLKNIHDQDRPAEVRAIVEAAQ